MSIILISNSNLILWLALIAGGAGIIGTGLGGVVGVLFKSCNNRTISNVLNYAAGIMLAVVFFELIPEAEELTGYSVYITLISMVVSVAIIFGLNIFLDRLNKKKKLVVDDKMNQLKNNGSLKRAGVVMLIAIALHNFPEGMAIGSTGAIPEHFGKAVMISILLALHNIPEGMAISVPLISGGEKSGKTILMTVMAGGVTMLGTLSGYTIGVITPLATAICLAAAAGAMLYVTFAEIIPEAVKLHNGKITGLYLLLGIISGMCIIYSANVF